MVLSEKTCVPCQGGAPSLVAGEIDPLAAEVPSWAVINEHHIERSFLFEDFKTALDFVIHVGEIAEGEGHHPEIYLGWGKARIMIWTHKIDGLTESDFILAAKIDRI